MKTIINFTGVIVQDEQTKNFTAFVAEMPEVIAEGRNSEEAMDNLMEAFGVINEFKKEEFMNSSSFTSSAIQQPIKLALS